MATARLIPSTYQLSNTSYLSITNATNMYANTDSTNYATIQNKQSGTSSHYIYLRGFNFDAIPSNATVNSFTVKIKAYESGVSTSTSYRPVLCNNTTTITGSSSVLTTSAKTITFTDVTASWETIKGYGSNFGIRVTNRRNNRNTTSYVYIYGAEILVDYTVPIPYDVNTSSTGCTITPSGTTTIEEGNDITIRIDSDGKPTVTDNGVDVSSSLVEKTNEIGYTVSTAPNASYGFSLNSNGYYESTNEAKASSASVCVVGLDLPVDCTITFKVINYAESTYDYGLISNIDKTLSNSASADTSNVFWNGKNNNSANEQTINYGTVASGNHTIYVKYFKDSYTDSNNDSFQFKIEITPNEPLTSDIYYEYTIRGITENHNIVAIYDPTLKQLYVKQSGVWKNVSEVYKKINGSWVKQTDLTSLFSANINYVQMSS